MPAARKSRGRPRKQKEQVLVMQIMAKKQSSSNLESEDLVTILPKTEEESINQQTQKEKDSDKVIIPVQEQNAKGSEKSSEQESENKTIALASQVSSEQKAKESLILTFLPTRAEEVKCSKCCHFTAPKLKYLALHYKTCSGKKVEIQTESKLQCHKCEFQTTDNESLEAHRKSCSMDQKTPTEKTVRCSNCPFKTSKLTLLAVHYKSCAKPEVGNNVLQPRNVE